MKVHFYDLTTGVFSSASWSGPERLLERCTPAGHGAFEANHVDHLSQRVDLATGDLVDYQPPAPSPDYQWNPETKRWVLSDEELAARAARVRALQRITTLEASQARALREHALGLPGASERLIAIDTEIALLRLDLQ